MSGFGEGGPPAKQVGTGGADLGDAQPKSWAVRGSLGAARWIISAGNFILIRMLHYPGHQAITSIQI